MLSYRRARLGSARSRCSWRPARRPARSAAAPTAPDASYRRGRPRARSPARRAWRPPAAAAAARSAAAATAARAAGAAASAGTGPMCAPGFGLSGVSGDAFADVQVCCWGPRRQRMRPLYIAVRGSGADVRAEVIRTLCLYPISYISHGLCSVPSTLKSVSVWGAVCGFSARRTCGRAAGR